MLKTSAEELGRDGSKVRVCKGKALYLVNGHLI